MGTDRDLTRNEKQRDMGQKRRGKLKKHKAKGTSGDFIDEGNTERCFAVEEPARSDGHPGHRGPTVGITSSMASLSGWLGGGSREVWCMERLMSLAFTLLRTATT